MELASFVVIFKPAEKRGWERLIGGWWGVAVHQAIIDLLLPTRTKVEGLSEEYYLSLYEDKENRKRPFTLSNLEVTPSGMFELRITALNSECCRHFEYLFKTEMAPGSVVPFDYIPLIVERIAFSPIEHPLAIRSSYPLIAQSSIDNGGRTNIFKLLFVSPVVFSRSKSLTYLPLPLPELVFRGLAETWNEMFGQEIISTKEIRILAYQKLAISEFKLESTMTPKKGGKSKGSIGWVQYELKSKDYYLMNTFSTLANYAFFAGVGKETAKGMGQVWLQ